MGTVGKWNNREDTRGRMQPTFLVLVFLVLLVLTFGSAFLNYRDHRLEVLHLLEAEGLALAKTAARAAESGPGGASVIREIGEVEGLAFAVIEDKAGVMALSRKAWDTPFPLEDPFIDRLLESGEAESRLITIHYSADREEEILEAVAPLLLEDGRQGIVRIGLETKHLAEARSRLIRTLLLRSGLFLVLGLGLIGYFSVANSRRFLARESDRMRMEISQYEEQRRRDERLTAMGELAGGVAHEIRNPLNTLRMLSQRLHREFESKEDEAEFKSFTATAVSEVDRIARIVDGFLEFARPAQTVKTEQNLGDKIRSLSESFRLQADGKGVDFEVEIKAEPTFPYDADLLDQALLNLLVNALDASAAGGRIGLSLRQTKGVAIIEVRDDGEGITEVNLGKVWDLYFSTKETGTGMGLPTVHRVVAEHGGRIELESEPEQGTLIRIHLPLENA